MGVIREGSENYLLYDEPAILDEMLLEFTSTADRCMEAVVTDDLDLWSECLDINFPSQLQQDTFRDLQERFKQGLTKQTVNPETVSDLCKAVTGVPELAAKITSRGKQLAQLQEELASEPPTAMPTPRSARRGSKETTSRFSFGKPEDEGDSAESGQN